MSSRKIEFYLDVLSPYAYLAAVALPEIASRHDARITYRPIDLSAAKLAAGNTGPANRDIPPKIRYLMTDLRRWAVRYGIPLGFPKSFRSEPANRAILLARREGRAEAFVRAVFDAVWGQGGDPSDLDLLASAADTAGLDGRAVVEGIDRPENLEEWKRENDEAHERGVFGVPFFIIGNEMFWGNDRLYFLEEYLSDGSVGGFRSPERD